MRTSMVAVPAVVAGAWFVADTVNAIFAAWSGPVPAPPPRVRALPAPDASGGVFVRFPGFGDGGEIAAQCPASVEVLSALFVEGQPELSLAAVRLAGAIAVVGRGDLLADVPIEQVGVDDVGIAEVLLRTRDGLVACRAERRNRAAAPAAGDGSPPGAVVLARREVDAILEGVDTGAWSGARVVPYFEGNEPKGFRVSGVRADSVLARIGVRNGDVVQSVNGMAITTPGAAFEAYSRFRGASELEATVLRNGKPETLRVEVR